MKRELQAIVADINKRYGAGTILPASQAKNLIVDRVSTGIFDLDISLGGGVPRGRITMVKGEWSTGKSALCMLIAAQFQRCDRFTGNPFIEQLPDGTWVERDFGRSGSPEPMRVVWLDAEHSYDPMWTSSWGVVSDDVLLIQTEFAEQAIDVADLCIRSKECDLLVVDSVAALTPGVEIEESSESWQMGVMARLMNKALRKWTSGMNSYGLLAETKATILLVNQMRMSIGGGRSFLTSPGGKGLDFFESVEIRFKRSSWVLDPITQRPVAAEIDYAITKNKTAPISNGGVFTLHFANSSALGIRAATNDYAAQIARRALYWKLISQKGAWYSFTISEPNEEGEIVENERKVQGFVKLVQGLESDPSILDHLRKAIMDLEFKWKETGEADVQLPKSSKESESKAE